MYLMQCRKIGLQKILAGYQKTGVPLIEFDSTGLHHFSVADDIGIYVIIPKLATLLDISCQAATNLFFYGLLIVPALIGIIGFGYYYKNMHEKIIACVGVLLLARQAYSIGDVYLAYYASVLTFTPWSLSLINDQLCTKRHYLYFFILGMSASLLHYIRAYSCVGILIFTFILLMSRKSSYQWISSYIFMVTLGFLLTTSYFSGCYNKSIIYTKNNLPESQIGDNLHPFWHAIYLGFGFLKSGNDIEYKDMYALEKARLKNPNVQVYTPEYEQILKQEVFDLAKNNFTFLMFTLFAKIGIFLLYILKYMHVGILAALWYRKPISLELAFLLGAGWYSLFPLLTMPTILGYSLGFISLCVMYGIVSINYALLHENNKRYTNLTYIKNYFIRAA